MKKLIIGRNNACDIIIPDTTDMVSRKQAVLTITFWGKMVLYDTSNNGTFLNGERIENGKGKRVTRKDKVSFAHVADLDWNTVPDPYKNSKKVIVWLIVIAILAAAAALWWYLQPQTDAQSKKENKTEQTKKQGETKTTVEPATTKPTNEQQPQNTNKKKKKQKADDDKSVSEVSENTPVIN